MICEIIKCDECEKEIKDLDEAEYSTSYKIKNGVYFETKLHFCNEKCRDKFYCKKEW